MENQEVYILAQEVLHSIVADLSQGIYKKLGGNLVLSWSIEEKVSAWAQSEFSPNQPPNHHIFICYELALKFYRDAEAFHDFSENILSNSNVQIIYKDFDPKPKLPDSLEKADSIRNMFMGSLTWVFFHELGHLMQEHGHIRSSFGNNQKTTIIEDCESDGSRTLDSRTAAISHTTEFAADIEATHWCTMELARHFLPSDRVGNKECKEEFCSNLYLMVCGISCALYRFYGLSSVKAEELPLTSHPTPVRRLELCIVNLFEKLDFSGFDEESHGLSRKQLINLCTGAADSAGFFWLWLRNNKNIPDNFMIKGLMQDDFKTSYWASIINTWDEIQPEINKVRHFGSQLGVLNFTPDFRLSVFGKNTQ